MSQAVELSNLDWCLQQKLNCKELRVINYSARNFLPVGGNYTSSVLKLDVTFSRKKDAPEETLNLICKEKTHSEDPYVTWVSILGKELFMYNELLPLYRELEREVGIKESDLIDAAPMCLGHCKTSNGVGYDVDDNTVMLLKNLNADGYYIGDRHTGLPLPARSLTTIILSEFDSDELKVQVESFNFFFGLDLKHASLTVRLLARYHALGIAMKQKRPKFAKRAIDMAKSPEFDLKQMIAACENCLRLFREHPRLNGNIAIIEKCYDLFLAGKQFEAQNLQPASPWATMSHGDCWVNNMLFRRDEKTKEINDVKFIDFQMFLHTSGTWDLAYFIGTSLDEAAAANHIPELLNLYYKHFVETLVRLQCDSTFCTREAFDIELKRSALYIFPLSAMVTKFVAFEAGENDDKNELVAAIFNDGTDAYVGNLQELVRVYEVAGWF